MEEEKQNLEKLGTPKISGVSVCSPPKARKMLRDSTNNENHQSPAEKHFANVFKGENRREKATPESHQQSSYRLRLEVANLKEVAKERDGRLESLEGKIDKLQEQFSELMQLMLQGREKKEVTGSPAPEAVDSPRQKSFSRTSEEDRSLVKPKLDEKDEEELEAELSLAPTNTGGLNSLQKWLNTEKQQGHNSVISSSASRREEEPESEGERELRAELMPLMRAARTDAAVRRDLDELTMKYADDDFLSRHAQPKTRRPSPIRRQRLTIARAEMTTVSPGRSSHFSVASQEFLGRHGLTRQSRARRSLKQEDACRCRYDEQHDFFDHYCYD